MTYDIINANKFFVRRFFEAMDERRYEIMESMLHDEHLLHLPMSEQALNSKEHMEMNKRIQSSLPIVNRIYDDQIAEGDKVVTRGRLSLLHFGEFNGFPATNKIVEVTFIHIMRIKDGLNAEEWDEINFVPLMKTLGVISETAGFDWH